MPIMPHILVDPLLNPVAETEPLVNALKLLRRP